LQEGASDEMKAPKQLAVTELCSEHSKWSMVQGNIGLKIVALYILKYIWMAILIL
jgi:hypothetical protein